MVTVFDIFHHIAQDLRRYSGADPDADVMEFVTGSIFDVHLAITIDFEETELKFLERYGQGHTFYFRIRNYEHGKRLAGEIFFLLQGVHPDMDAYTGEHFEPGQQLYLFIHLRDVIPPAVE
jgi:hypothetical protein